MADRDDHPLPGDAPMHAAGILQRTINWMRGEMERLEPYPITPALRGLLTQQQLNVVQGMFRLKYFIYIAQYGFRYEHVEFPLRVMPLHGAGGTPLEVFLLADSLRAQINALINLGNNDLPFRLWGHLCPGDEYLLHPANRVYDDLLRAVGAAREQRDRIQEAAMSMFAGRQQDGGGRLAQLQPIDPSVLRQFVIEPARSQRPPLPWINNH